MINICPCLYCCKTISSCDLGLFFIENLITYSSIGSSIDDLMIANTHLKQNVLTIFYCVQILNLYCIIYIPLTSGMAQFLISKEETSTKQRKKAFILFNTICHSFLSFLQWLPIKENIKQQMKESP